MSKKLNQIKANQINQSSKLLLIRLHDLSIYMYIYVYVYISGKSKLCFLH